MKNLHVLPTDKPSRYVTNYMEQNMQWQNIYITNLEEIKEGDWFIRDGSIHKCFRVHKTDIEFLTSIDSVYCGSNTFWGKEFCKKIILTTDTDLISDGVQAIPDEFLEWYIKNPSCEWVEVFSQNVYSMGKWDTRHAIIIPKEEHKQETLEEAAERYAESNQYDLECHDEGCYQGIDTKIFAKKLIDFTNKWFFPF